MGKAAGEVILFDPEEVKVRVKSDTLSTHGFGLAEVIELMKSLDIKTELKIIGIQPKTIEYGEGLSEEVSSQKENIIGLIKENLK